MALTATGKTQAFALMTTRLDRISMPAQQTAMVQARIDATEAELARKGIILTDSIDDVMLLVDKAVWDYQSRDKQQGEPDWLKLKLRERWLAENAT